MKLSVLDQSTASEGRTQDSAIRETIELARHCGPGLRVNAIAPGFFVTTQNRAVLVKEDGSPTDRGRAILARTPMGRFGDPAELSGAVLWLCSDAASFVTGVVIPIDGGFSADGGI